MRRRRAQWARPAGRHEDGPGPSLRRLRRRGPAPRATSLGLPRRANGSGGLGTRLGSRDRRARAGCFCHSYRFDDLGRLITLVALPTPTRIAPGSTSRTTRAGRPPDTRRRHSHPRPDGLRRLGRPTLECSATACSPATRTDERLRLARTQSQKVTTAGASSPDRGPVAMSYEWDLSGTCASSRSAASAWASPVTPIAFAGRCAMTLAIARRGHRARVRAPLPPGRWDPAGLRSRRTRSYRERYDYDAVGNLLRLSMSRRAGVQPHILSCDASIG